MLINAELAKAINEQIGREFGASMQYLSIAGHFQTQKLMLLTKLFFEQAEEEKVGGVPNPARTSHKTNIGPNLSVLAEAT